MQRPGLEQKTHYGRPDWTKLFGDYSKSHAGSMIGVFVCGPKVISEQIAEKCAQHSANGTTFRFNKENF